MFTPEIVKRMIGGGQVPICGKWYRFDPKTEKYSVSGDEMSGYKEVGTYQVYSDGTEIILKTVPAIVEEEMVWSTGFVTREARKNIVGL